MPVGRGFRGKGLAKLSGTTWWGISASASIEIKRKGVILGRLLPEAVGPLSRRESTVIAREFKLVVLLPGA